MSEKQALRPVEFIDNYFPVIDGVTETVHEYARHMNAPVVCPAMESRYLEKHGFPYPVLTSLTLRIPFSRYASAVPALDGKLAGNCSICGIGARRKIRHRCSLAITLYKEYWGLGIGSAMIDYLTKLAVKIGFEQIDLEVVADNTRAKALYRKCGFEESGRRIRALKFDDGTYHDEVLMTKILKG